MDIDKVILENQHLSILKLSQLVMKSTGCIEYRLKKLGIKKRHPKSVSLEAFIKDNLSMPPHKIAEIMKAKKASVICAFRRLGLDYLLPQKERVLEIFEVKDGIIKDLWFCPITGYQLFTKNKRA